MLSIHSSIFHTPWGNLKVMHNQLIITHASFTSEELSTTINTSFDEKIRRALDTYCSDPSYVFTLPNNPQGTPYQMKVWQNLLNIPAGKIQTYGQLAKQIDSGPRAIGQACKKNPIALFIPCHRVIGANSIGGYMGNPNALGIKQALLNHEKAYFS